MKLARFSIDAQPRLGRIDGDRITDLTAAFPAFGHSMRALLTALPDCRDAVAHAAGPWHALADVRLEAPITDPQKFLAIGMNYKAHAEESARGGVPVPKTQLWFNKQVSCIAGPYDDIALPTVAPDKVDYEAELAFVIGKRCRHVSRADARGVIAGYMLCNDVSTRDWQLASPTFTLGKSFDTHGPIGPWITTDDEVADPHALELRLFLNGEERQFTSTGDMIYDIHDQIAHLSTVMTLEPGDVIATGTPSNVGIATGTFLKPDDVVRIEATGLGHIENRFRPEAALS